MKTCITLIFCLSTAQAVAVECQKVGLMAHGKQLTTTINMSAHEGHAHLVQTCAMPPRGSCSFYDEYDAVYTKTFRPTRLQIWDLTKISGDGPDQLTWEEYEGVGTLSNGPKTLCSKRISQ